MSKTAEDILRQELNITAVKHGEDPVLNEDWDDWKDEQGPEFMNAMWDSFTKFSAQGVEAYKIRVKDAISSAVDEAIADGKKTHMIMFNWKDIYTIIEGVK